MKEIHTEDRDFYEVYYNGLLLQVAIFKKQDPKYWIGKDCCICHTPLSDQKEPGIALFGSKLMSFPNRPAHPKCVIAPETQMIELQRNWEEHKLLSKTFD